MFNKICDWCHKRFISNDDVRFCCPECSYKYRATMLSEDEDAFQDYVEDEIYGRPKHQYHFSHKFTVQNGKVMKIRIPNGKITGKELP